MTNYLTLYLACSMGWMACLPTATGLALPFDYVRGSYRNPGTPGPPRQRQLWHGRGRCAGRILSNAAATKPVTHQPSHTGSAPGTTPPRLCLHTASTAADMQTALARPIARA